MSISEPEKQPSLKMSLTDPQLRAIAHSVDTSPSRDFESLLARAGYSKIVILVNHYDTPNKKDSDG